MAITTDFVSAINQISAERGIDSTKVYEALEVALASAYKKEKDISLEAEVEINIDKETGEFRVVEIKEVVEKVEDKDTQISLKEAKKYDKSLEVGDKVEIQGEYDDFGRIAAQTAKQVVLQEIRNSEREAVMAEYEDKVGQVFTAMMQRMQRGRVLFEIGKAIAYMPLEEQIPNEFYRISQRYKVLLKEIIDEDGMKQLIVSRSDPKFLKELFVFEVPEIESGVIEIMSIAREPGSRSKIAVKSNQDGVDAIGSCVGQRGIRIANVMGELGEEKIDIIEWDEEIEQYIANALSPAKVISVEVNSKDKSALVVVADDQLSLAIGKDGQNVRLAHKLTNHKIDIEGESGKSVEVIKEEKEEDLKKDAQKREDFVEGKESAVETTDDESKSEKDTDKKAKSKSEKEVKTDKEDTDKNAKSKSENKPEKEDKDNKKKPKSKKKSSSKKKSESKTKEDSKKESESKKELNS
ncbi:MAG TPA: transcription termination/antitermination protein NusA [bacterium]|nr:transcription termination/antitermination protein NusA [bacterium]